MDFDSQSGKTSSAGRNHRFGLEVCISNALVDNESQVFVERTVPQHFTEGCKRDCRTALLDRPRPHPFEQCPPDSVALGVRKTADLFNVGVPVDLVYKDVGNRLVVCIYGHPTPPAGCISRQLSIRRRFIICDGIHPDRPKHLSGRSLDLSKSCTFIWTRSTYSDHPHILARSGRIQRDGHWSPSRRSGAGVFVLDDRSRLANVDSVVKALTDQQAETAIVLEGVTIAEAERATRCVGWSVADVLLHLAQSDEMAITSLTDGFGAAAVDNTSGWGGGTSVDESVAVMVERERGAPFEDVVNRWRLAAAALVATLGGMDLSTRVPWVAGNLSARTLATTRMSETWIHTQDIADAIGVDLVPSDRLKLIARLAWRTLPYAFHSSGLTMAGPVAFRLIGPSGERWEFLPDGPEMTTISGSAVELCAVAARRIDPAATTLAGEGPDVADVLALVRTYA
jgi:uncharacterized protein (TIGR03084 family)